MRTVTIPPVHVHVHCNKHPPVHAYCNTQVYDGTIANNYMIRVLSITMSKGIDSEVPFSWRVYSGTVCVCSIVSLLALNFRYPGPTL